MKLQHKKQINLFFLWLVFGVVGYLLNLIIIRPIMYTWPSYYSFTDNAPYILYELVIADILLLPALLLTVYALLKSIREKKYAWAVVHLVGILLIGLFVMFFAIPIIRPSRGL
jgi:hypothetical protein